MFCEDLNILKTEIEKLSEGVAVILAAEKGFLFDDIQPVLEQANVPAFGAFFPGIIAEEELHYSGYLLLQFKSEAEIYTFDTLDIDSVSFAKSEIETGTGLILIDGLANSNQDFLNSLFYELGQDVKFIGSGAGSLELVQKPCIFDKNGIYENKAILLLLRTNVAIGIKHGYTRLAGPFVATETKATKVSQLNWENAYTSYANVVNSDSVTPITQVDFFSIAKGYPLGISRNGHEDIVRDPISVDEDGTLNCIDDVPENAALYILKGEPDRLIQAAEMSCVEALEQVSGDPDHCFLIDCVSRVLYLGDDFTKEIQTATKKIHAFYPDLHVKGVLSLGEISTFKDGRLELYNKTFLTTMIYDK